MKILREGHLYELQNFESKETKGQELQFIEKMPQKMFAEDGVTEVPTGVLVTINEGTTNEEVIEVLIDRMKYLQAKFPCKENACAITHLEESLMWLEKRTRDREKRNVEGKHIA